jgi:hypothetical protein
MSGIVSPKIRAYQSCAVGAAPLTIGRVIPALLAAGAALIVFSGCLPLSWIHLLDYEAARRILQWDAPFMPNQRLRTSYHLGEEAFEGNYPSTELLPLRDFSTDRFGFRYTPPVKPGKPDELIVFRGDSFTFGAGLADDQTLPSLLERRLGVNAYNSARFGDPETPEDFDRLMARIGAQPKTVVYVELEGIGDTVLSPATMHRSQARRLLRFLKELPMTWLRISPAFHFAGLAKRAVENDLILGNRYRDIVTSFPLPDGRPMLAVNLWMSKNLAAADESVVDERSAYIAWWDEHMRRLGARMFVLLVPDKMSVYGPSVGLAMPADPFLNRMERNLTARGVRVVNLLTPFRANVRAELASGRLSYFREDPHWTALGVERAADAAAQAIRPSFSEPAAALSRAR